MINRTTPNKRYADTEIADTKNSEPIKMKYNFSL